MKTIWQQLPPSFLVLAPMDKVSDSVFRGLLAQHGPPHLFFTEFVSAAAIIQRQPHALLKLQYQPQECPLIAQIWGCKPEEAYRAAQFIAEKNFAGIDLNLGCPKPQLTGKGCGAALMRQPQLTCELIHACREGAGTLPVSAKTRIGWQEADSGWLELLLRSGIAALTIHYRLARPRLTQLNHPDYPLWQTLKGYLPKALADGPADFRLSEQILALRQSCAPQVKIIANGGLFAPSFDTQLPPHDGWMIGRAAIEDPFFFTHVRNNHARFSQLQPFAQISFALEHLRLHRAHYQKVQGETCFPLLKRFFASYLRYSPTLAALLSSDGYQHTEALLLQQLSQLEGEGHDRSQGSYHYQPAALPDRL